MPLRGDAAPAFLHLNPLPAEGGSLVLPKADAHYVNAVLARLQEMATVRQVANLKSKLQRMNPVEAPDEYTKVFGQLVAPEQQARSLRERAMGGLTP